MKGEMSAYSLLHKTNADSIGILLQVLQSSIVCNTENSVLGTIDYKLKNVTRDNATSGYNYPGSFFPE